MSHSIYLSCTLMGRMQKFPYTENRTRFCRRFCRWWSENPVLSKCKICPSVRIWLGCYWHRLCYSTVEPEAFGT